MARTYNYIYKKLVEDETDIVGHVAYALYKADKIKFIEDFKAKNNGRELGEMDLKPFHDISCLDTSIARYKTQALQVLQAFLHNTLDETTKQIEEDVIKRHKQSLSEIIEPIKPKRKWTLFWHGVAQSIAGAFFFALMVAAFAFIKTYSASDINISFGTKGTQTQVQQEITEKDSLYK